MISTFQANLKSGVTVALVSLPLSIPLALVSGVTPTQGIITAIWAGLIGALFGGSNYNIIGLTGALSGFIASYALTNGIEQVPYLAMCVGILILGAYLLRLERYLVLVPTSVIHGFTLGIAGIIALSQIGNAVGIMHGSVFDLAQWSAGAVLTCLFFLALLLVLRFIQFPIPGVILITPFSLLLGWLSQEQLIPFSLQTLGSRYGAITPQLFDFHFVVTKPPLIPALVIAIIAILETLLSAKIADGMTGTRHNQRKEILGLGLANIVSGVMGGIPATAALARTSFNIKAGAANHYSAVISSVTIALISFFFISFFSYLPLPVIAAVLISVAIGMIEGEHFIRLYTYDKVSFAISLLVAGVTVYEDPIIGILMGTVIALFFLIERLMVGAFEIQEKSGILIYALKGELVYLNGSVQQNNFENAARNYRTIILNLHTLNFLDLDGVHALDEMISRAHAHNKKLAIAQVPVAIYPLLHAVSPEFKRLEEQGLVCADDEQAVAQVRAH